MYSPIYQGKNDNESENESNCVPQINLVIIQNITLDKGFANKKG